MQYIVVEEDKYGFSAEIGRYNTLDEAVKVAALAQEQFPDWNVRLFQSDGISIYWEQHVPRGTSD